MSEIKTSAIVFKADPKMPETPSLTIREVKEYLDYYLDPELPVFVDGNPIGYDHIRRIVPSDGIPHVNLTTETQYPKGL